MDGNLWPRLGNSTQEDGIDCRRRCVAAESPGRTTIIPAKLWSRRNWWSANQQLGSAPLLL